MTSQLLNLRKNNWISSKGLSNVENKGELLVITKSNDNDFEYVCYEKISSFAQPNYFNIEGINRKTLVIEFNVTVIGNIKSSLFIIGYSNKEKKLVEQVSVNSNKIITLSQEIIGLKIAIRVQGTGTLEINKIQIEQYNNLSDIINDFCPSSTISRYLVLTNVYPSYDDLYKNGFVHRRVKAYKEMGLSIDVFSMKNKGQLSKYSYDGVNVFQGGKDTLIDFLNNTGYSKILIHFINKDMYDAIELSKPNTPLIIWIHGIETERWYRRLFNIKNEEELKNIISKVEENYEKIKFMKYIYSRQDNNIKFVFVSKWFKEQVAEFDANTSVNKNNYEIIPNLVDDDIFNYVKKDEEQRKKILTIRPFASNKYANDLSVKAILELAKKPFFSELYFEIYGEGALFNDTVKPLKGFSNIKIVNKFLSQEEIATLHKQFGIFLCPTRLDSQGVSMCEAMSSGLVPVTINTTAIPEFVTEFQGILAPEEDYVAMANGIEEIYNNPSMFLQMSVNSSKLIQDKCGKEKIIEKECAIIKS